MYATIVVNIISQNKPLKMTRNHKKGHLFWNEGRSMQVLTLGQEISSSFNKMLSSERRKVRVQRYFMVPLALQGESRRGKLPGLFLLGDPNGTQPISWTHGRKQIKVTHNFCYFLKIMSFSRRNIRHVCPFNLKIYDTYE